MKNCAFIFARGGSKGLPRKNIKLLAGKPLLQYSIDTALATPSIEHVFVSTD
ncbi:cytidylyltransferase domain-containing protein, partial [Vibrio vulnificus]